jgi:hypothetical protein
MGVTQAPTDVRPILYYCVEDFWLHDMVRQGVCIGCPNSGCTTGNVEKLLLGLLCTSGPRDEVGREMAVPEAIRNAERENSALEVTAR